MPSALRQPFRRPEPAVLPVFALLPAGRFRATFPAALRETPPVAPWPRLSRCKSSLNRSSSPTPDRSLAGNLRDQRQQPVRRGSEFACSAFARADLGRRCLDFSQPRLDHLAPHLAGRGARQVRLRPQHPAAQPLKLRQPLVGAFNGRRGSIVLAAHGQHGAGFRSRWPFPSAPRRSQPRPVPARWPLPGLRGAGSRPPPSQ